MTPSTITPADLYRTAAEMDIQAAWYTDAAAKYREAAGVIERVTPASVPLPPAPSTLPNSQFKVLEALNGKAVTFKQLRVATELPTGTVSSALHFLEKKGLIQRIGFGVYQRAN